MRKIFTMCLLSLPLLAQDPCIKGSASNITIRHRDPKGMGYNDGYTTAALFVTPNWNRKIQPFFDGRYHILNNGKMATNIGGGMRFAVGDPLVLGTNIFYDFRDARDLRSHQMAGGLELLHPVFDWRINGYLPIGRKEARSPRIFSRVVGNFFELKRRLVQNMPHVESLFGAWLPKSWPVDIYASVGPYYLFREAIDGATCGKAWGVKTALELTLFDGFVVGGQWTYDREFHGRPQGYASLSFPFGPANIRRGGSRWKKWYGGGCDTQATRQRLMVSPVRRDEIIPICDRELDLGRAFVINGNGQDTDLVCWFVDNSAPAGGDGTFDNPFNSIALAEAAASEDECIYVFFTGNQPANVYNEGITLQPGQFYQGSGQNFVINGVTVFPAQTADDPIIAAPGGAVIAIADRVQVNGFAIATIGATGVSGSGNDVRISGISTLGLNPSSLIGTLYDLTLGGTSSLFGSSAVGTSGNTIVINPDANVVISNVSFSSAALQANTLDVTLNSATLIFMDNEFNSAPTGAQVQLTVDTSSSNTNIVSSNNTFRHANVAGTPTTYNVTFASGSNPFTMTSTGETFFTSEAGSVEFITVANSVASSSYILSNSSYGSSAAGYIGLISTSDTGSSAGAYSITGNTFSGTAPATYFTSHTSGAGATSCVEITGNTFSAAVPISFASAAAIDMTVEATSAAAVTAANNGAPVLGAASATFSPGTDCVP